MALNGSRTGRSTYRAGVASALALIGGALLAASAVVPTGVRAVAPGGLGSGVAIVAIVLFAAYYTVLVTASLVPMMGGSMNMVLVVMPTLLLYGTGGFAYADVQNNGGLYGTNQNSATQTGWTAGGGAEWMFMPNWSVKAEYLYTDVSGGNSNYWGGNWGTSINNVNNHTRWNTVRAGVNYHFNWGAAPVVAKY